MTLGIAILLILALLVVAGRLGLFSGSPDPNLGVHNGRLAPCPNSPNCISSQSDDESHFVEPIPCEGSIEQINAKLVGVLNSMKRVRLIANDPSYVRSAFTSPIFRFVDDVEFYINADEHVIHVRSASRLGYSDLGANRKRVERIRREFARR